MLHVAGHDVLRVPFKRSSCEDIVVGILAHVFWFKRIYVDHVTPRQAQVGDNCGDIVLRETQLRPLEHFLKLVKNCW